MASSGDLSGQPSEVTSDVDVSFLKIIILTTLTAITAAAVGYFMVNPHPVYSLFSIGTFLTLFVFQVLLVKSWKKILLAVLAESVFLALPIIIDIRSVSQYFLLAWLIFVFIATYTEYTATHKIKNSLRLPFWKVSRMVFVSMLSAILLFASIVYIFVPAPSDSKLAAASSAAGEIAVVRPIKYFIPEFSSSTTAGQLFIIMAEKTIEGQKITQELSAADKERLVQDTAAKYRSLIEDRVGPIDSSLPVAAAIGKTASNYMSNLDAFGFFMANVVIFLSLWLFFKGIAFLIYLPASLVIFLVYETLIVTNFISIQYESRSREIAILK